MSRPMRAVLVLAVTGLLMAGCAGGAGSDGGKVSVVASTSVWGNLVQQIGGDAVTVTSVIQGQDVDAHDYEPSPADGRAVARAKYVIINGLHYDEWAEKLIAANRASDRTVLEVGELLGLEEGDNPHRWYSPNDVQQVIDRITADLKSIDPANAAGYDERRATLVSTSLQDYRGLVASIKRDFAGQPVGATESVAAPLVEELGLRLLSPAAFMEAIAEGVDPTPQDKATMESQIRQRQIRVLIVNKQNSTPDVQRLVEAARSVGVPTVYVTETPPADATFQSWQTTQLQALSDALRQGAGTR